MAAQVWADWLSAFCFMNDTESLRSCLNSLASEIHTIAVDHGWWEQERNDGECVALMHSELSEALEGMRHGNPASDKIPEFSQVEEEYADCIIRILDHAHRRGWDIAGSVLSKIEYNRNRPYKHGGKKF